MHQGIVTFLETKRPKDQLKIALEVLREFKECESREEWLSIMFAAWTKLEQFEEFLDHLVNEAELQPDTIRELEQRKIA